MKAAENSPLRHSDAQLLDSARRGDDRAFHELIDRHAARLFRLAVRMVGSAADAEDVVQETLMGALQHMRRFEGRSSVKTWLTRILLRQAARHHRRRARSSTVPLAEPSAGPDQGRAGRSVPGGVHLGLDVQQALGRLSAEHREVVVLREFEGLSYAEMAEALDVPQGTVESRLYRARQELKTILSDYIE